MSFPKDLTRYVFLMGHTLSNKKMWYIGHIAHCLSQQKTFSSNTSHVKNVCGITSTITLDVCKRLILICTVVAH